MRRRAFLSMLGGTALGAVPFLAETAEASPIVVAGAGDIAASTSPSKAQKQTAALVSQIAPAQVLVFGDCQYVDGTLAEYQRSYDPTWGVFYSITQAAPGDHDYNTANAQGYKDYWNRSRTYFSFDLGGWHFICLDSRIDHSATSAQVAWLTSDFAATTLPTIAYFAHPRWSSGSKHGPDSGVGPCWNVLYDGGSQRCKLILNGHEHFYERFARMTPDGAVSAATGVRQITVGTGGAGLYGFASAATGSQFRDDTHHGVIRLTLSASALVWDFLAAGTGNVLDTGSDPT